MDPVDEERPSRMRSNFMPNPLGGFNPSLTPTQEGASQRDHAQPEDHEERPSAVRNAWHRSTDALYQMVKPLEVQKKTEDGTMKIGNSHTSEKVKALLRTYDVNGDDTLDIDEVTALVEHLLKEERQGRNLRWVVIGLIIFTCVLIAAMAGLTYAIVYAMKDTKVTNTIMVDKDSGMPIRVSSTDFTVTKEGLMAYRPTPLGEEVKDITPTAGDTMRTAAYTGTTQALHSGMDVNEVVEMNFIHLESGHVSVSLRVNGVARVEVPQSQYGSVLQINTDQGTIILDGDLISYDEKLKPLLAGQGFKDKKRRRMLLQGQGTEVDGMYNRIVNVPPIEPLPFQDYRDAWQVVAESAEEADQLSAKMRQLIEDGAFDNEFSSMWASWKTVNDKTYPSIEADTAAFHQWKLNMMPVVNINSNTTLTYWTSINAFSDISFYQFAAERLLTSPMNLTALQQRVEGTERHRRLVEAYQQRRKLQQDFGDFILPKVDWVMQGKVTPVKDQGACGSCWAHAAAAALESAYLIATNQYVQGPDDNSVIDISEQQLISCVNGFTNEYFQSIGCDGGDPYEALSYAFLDRVTVESVMPDVSGRTASTGICDFITIRNLVDKQVVQVGEDALYAYPFNDEEEIKRQVMRQPVACYFMVDETFNNYAGGIYEPTTCTTATNHNMLIVGYDTTGPKPYWLIKNQWGTGWGEKGYAKVLMTGDEWGPCGMYGFASFPPLDLVVALGKKLTDKTKDNGAP